MQLKQVIVIRKKYPDENGNTKGVRMGKAIAQACHASMAFLTEPLRQNKPLELTTKQRVWIENSFTKICVSVDSEEELDQIADKARALGIDCHVITDSGKTEFNGVPTKTCLALGPDWDTVIDEVTGELKLL